MLNNCLIMSFTTKRLIIVSLDKICYPYLYVCIGVKKNITVVAAGSFMFAMINAKITNKKGTC